MLCTYFYIKFLYDKYTIVSIRFMSKLLKSAYKID